MSFSNGSETTCLFNSLYLFQLLEIIPWLMKLYSFSSYINKILIFGTFRFRYLVKSEWEMNMNFNSKIATHKIMLFQYNHKLKSFSFAFFIINLSKIT